MKKIQVFPWQALVDGGIELEDIQGVVEGGEPEQDSADVDDSGPGSGGEAGCSDGT